MGIRAGFDRFLVYLAEQHAPDDVRSLGNIVLAHLPHLAEVSCARRARSSRLAPIAINELPGGVVERCSRITFTVRPNY